MIAWRPAAAAMDQERFEVRPLIVGHQSANQGCPPQRAALNQFAILASIGLSTRPQLGCSEGKNLIFDFRTAEGQLERLPELAAKFVAMSSDVIERRFDMETAKAAQAAIFARLAAA